jgi:SAM-dependent methyltransferase
LRPDLLVCPACRTVGDGRIDLRTLSGIGDELVCDCGARYPIVDGVAMFAMTNAVAADDDVTREHVSIYMDAHWHAASPFVARIAARPPVAYAVELGCSAGGIVHALAGAAGHVVGVELGLPILRLARRVLAGEPADYERRVIGSHYEAARAMAPSAVENVTLVCGDALDPPLVPRAYQRVVALNLLDSVRDPLELLTVCDALCEPGGELILSSPYAWSSAITPDDKRFGGADPAAALVAHLKTGFTIEDEAELSWMLRRDSRCEITYRVHYVRARKAPAGAVSAT